MKKLYWTVIKFYKQRKVFLNIVASLLGILFFTLLVLRSQGGILSAVNLLAQKIRVLKRIVW